MEKKIFLGGLGGQGVVMGGKLIGSAAVMDGKFATNYAEYAPAMRNGYTYTTLMIADEEVGAQVSACYDCMAFFDERSCVTQKESLKDKGVYILNSSLVETMPDESKGTIYQIPASNIADELGNAKLLNVIMMGAIIEATDCVDMASLEKVISATFGKSPKIVKLNLEALKKGASIVVAAREGRAE